MNSNFNLLVEKLTFLGHEYIEKLHAIYTMPHFPIVFRCYFAFTIENSNINSINENDSGNEHQAGDILRNWIYELKEYNGSKENSDYWNVVASNLEYAYSNQPLELVRQTKIIFQEENKLRLEAEHCENTINDNYSEMESHIDNLNFHVTRAKDIIYYISRVNGESGNPYSYINETIDTILQEEMSTQDKITFAELVRHQEDTTILLENIIKTIIFTVEKWRHDQTQEFLGKTASLEELPMLEKELKAVSLPIIVLTHGSQKSKATGPLFWDSAFTQPGQLTGVCDVVPWDTLAAKLEQRWNGQLQCSAKFSQRTLKYLGDKCFQGKAYDEGSLITKKMFYQDNLRGRRFTFWTWFDKILELVKHESLCPHWQQGHIVGFIGRNECEEILYGELNGTFLLRFSDSQLGAVTYSHKNNDELHHYQPQTVKDFSDKNLAKHLNLFPSLVHCYMANDLIKLKSSAFPKESDKEASPGYIKLPSYQHDADSVLQSPRDRSEGSFSMMDPMILPATDDTMEFVDFQHFENEEM